MSAASRPGALFWKTVLPVRVLDRDRDRHVPQRVRGVVAQCHDRGGAFGAMYEHRAEHAHVGTLLGDRQPLFGEVRVVGGLFQLRALFLRALAAA